MFVNKETIKNIKKLCRADKSIGLFYLFGSQATGEVGPLSDYDFAVYFDEFEKRLILEKKIGLIVELSNIMKTDNLDLVILNEEAPPELKYSIIRDGQLIFEREPFRTLVEPKIMNEYFDFRTILLRHGLTQKVYVE